MEEPMKRFIVCACWVSILLAVLMLVVAKLFLAVGGVALLSMAGVATALSLLIYYTAEISDEALTSTEDTTDPCTHNHVQYVDSR